MIESIFKETNIDSIKKFNVQWEKFLKTSGNDSIKANQEAIRRFNQAMANRSNIMLSSSINKRLIVF